MPARQLFSRPVSPAEYPQGPDSDSSKVFRGGSWGTDWVFVRAAYRNNTDPTERHYLVGFWCAYSPGG